MGKRIYVGNLPPEFTADQLCALFAAYGAVTSAEVIAEKSGQSRGFGFVEMTNSAEATAAINALNGTDVDGRTINVNEARPKPEGGGRPSSERRSRGGESSGGYSGGGNRRSY